MTTISISLPDEMNAFIESQVGESRYASADDFVRALIREAQKRQAIQNLNEKLREAIESGPATPMTREDWAGLERAVRERQERQQRQEQGRQ